MNPLPVYPPLKKLEPVKVNDPVAQSLAKPDAFAKPATINKPGTRMRTMKVVKQPGRPRKHKRDVRDVQYF